MLRRFLLGGKRPFGGLFDSMALTGWEKMFDDLGEWRREIEYGWEVDKDDL